MALPRIGIGAQIGDGNLNEIQAAFQGDPATPTATATLTVAQLATQLIVANPSTTAASYTLPTAALMDATLDTVKPNVAFVVRLVNLGTASGAITIVAGTGWTLVGSATIAVTSSAELLLRRTANALASTGSAWTLYRIS